MSAPDGSERSVPRPCQCTVGKSGSVSSEWEVGWATVAVRMFCARIKCVVITTSENPVLSACRINSPISSIIIVIADLRLTGLYREILTFNDENYEIYETKESLLIYMIQD